MLKKPTTIKVQAEEDLTPRLLTVKEFEDFFNITFEPALTFLTEDALRETLNNCPYFFRFRSWYVSLLGTRDEKEALYLHYLMSGLHSKVFVKWISSAIGYGLFADHDIPKHGYIGQYSGIVRKALKDENSLNEFCFHYPTKFFSPQLFVIDASDLGNLIRFINHSDTPNLQPLWICHERLMHLILIANKPISKGDELTFNYGKEYWTHRKKI